MVIVTDPFGITGAETTDTITVKNHHESPM